MSRFQSRAQWAEMSRRTVGHYSAHAQAFWEATQDHDVSQNLAALLGRIEGSAPLRVLDLGCGPGRDLASLRALGHVPVGLDGCARFCEMARAHSGCEVWHQDFLALDLPASHFDGVYANASLFHVPRLALPGVLGALHGTLRPRGVLFASNPRGDDQEGWQGERYGVFHELPRWQALVGAAGFELLEHYYRPPGKPRDQQPWLATVFRRLEPAAAQPTGVG